MQLTILQKHEDLFFRLDINRKPSIFTRKVSLKNQGFCSSLQNADSLECPKGSIKIVETPQYSKFYFSITTS